MEDDRIRLLNIPTINGTIKTVIHRLPKEDISEENQRIEGVPDHHRLILMDWVMYRAYSQQDAELFDPDKAKNSETAFYAAMSKVRSDDMKRNNKPRVAGYGGI